MKINIDLGKRNTAALRALVKPIQAMNKNEAVTPEAVAKEALKNFIASEYYKMLQNEK